MGSSQSESASQQDEAYPLFPGISPVACGECWKCGDVGYLSSACSSTLQVPTLEQKWRLIAASIKRWAEADIVTVNLVAEDGLWID